MFNYQAPADLLKDRTILVTGAGDGIGAAAAVAYAQAGATVILLGRTVKKLETVYDLIEERGGKQPALFPLNLESAGEADYVALANAIDENFGHLDGVLHNASLLGNITPAEQYPLDVWNRVMQVNVNAAFALTRFLIPLLRKSPDPSLVFTTSSVGRKGRAYWGAYAVSKFATEGLVQVLTDELTGKHDPIRVNAINPGATRTRMRATAYPGENPDTNPPAQDIMPLYLYLMGPDSRGVSGKSLDAQGNDTPDTLI
ncbi:MAG: YciK family oxidoreductase [Hahellaceae bacterium]|nr:YciK family oxidoreductase [Hahellaceae bacterium]